MRVHIEPARPADLPALIELLALLFAIEQDFHPDVDRQRRGLELLLAQPAEQARIFVARRDDATQEVVGMVSAQLVISTASGAPSAWLEDLVVRAAYRSQGLGRQLLDAAIAWALARGARRVQLLADADNQPALDVYQRLGWQPTRLFAWRQFPGTSASHE
jgi:ribosomal protein S18 acetylase RimI-like enzyme